MKYFTIATAAEQSADFRRVLWTGKHMQLVIMTIPPGGEIGAEIHEGDQVLSFVSGVGEAIVGGETRAVTPGDLVAVPAGTEHNFTNAGPNPTIAAMFNQRVQSVYFELDKADLTPESQDKLRRGAEWLTQGPNRSITFRIEGNCDPRGTDEYNIGLGERRAQAAKEFLISLGVEGSRIQTVSYGKERASGASEGSPGQSPSWAHDRRDDFIYIGGGTPPRNP